MFYTWDFSALGDIAICLQSNYKAADFLACYRAWDLALSCYCQGWVGSAGSVV